MANEILPADAFDENLNVRVNKLASKLSLLMERRATRPLGISSPEARILINLARFGDSHLRLLSRNTSLDASHISKIMPKMEQKGLISRTKDKQDKRLVLFSLTENGRKVFGTIWPHANSFAEEVRSLFNDDEFKLIRDGIDRAIDHIDGLLENAPSENGNN